MTSNYRILATVHGSHIKHFSVKLFFVIQHLQINTLTYLLLNSRHIYLDNSVKYMVQRYIKEKGVIEMEENTNQGKNMMMIGIVIAVLIVGAVMVLTNRNADETTMDSSTTPTDVPNSVNDSTMIEDGSAEDSAETGVEASDGTMEGDVRVFDIEGGSFYYEPNLLTVKAGEPVKVVLTSVDMMHDFVVDGTDIKTEILESGESGEVEFTIDEPGTYEFYCSVGEHRANGMVGTLIVE